MNNFMIKSNNEKFRFDTFLIQMQYLTVIIDTDFE